MSGLERGVSDTGARTPLCVPGALLQEHTEVFQHSVSFQPWSRFRSNDSTENSIRDTQAVVPGINRNITFTPYSKSSGPVLGEGKRRDFPIMTSQLCSNHLADMLRL